MTVLALNASHSTTTKTHALAEAAAVIDGEGRVLDLATLDAAGLLGRSPDPEVHAALDAIAGAGVLVIATPVYRATYTGLLKVLFDQLPSDALTGTACVLVATGGSPHHSLCIDTGLRPLVASLGGWSVPTGVYATGADFDDEGKPDDALLATLERALTEARAVLTATSPQAG